MIIRQWNETLTGQRGMAIGVFDGVHLGHVALLSRLRENCQEEGLIPTVLTFRTNPRRSFLGKDFPGDIQSLEQKLESLEALALSEVILVDFDPSFADVKGDVFLDEIRTRFGVRGIFMGRNTRIGSGGALHSEDARREAIRLGMKAVIVEPVRLGTTAISSSVIRDGLAKGNWDDVSGFLGRRWELDASSWDHAAGGYLLNERPTQVLPPPGKYPFQGPSGEGGVLSLKRDDKAAEIRLIKGPGLPDRLRFV